MHDKHNEHAQGSFTPSLGQRMYLRVNYTDTVVVTVFSRPYVRKADTPDESLRTNVLVKTDDGKILVAWIERLFPFEEPSK